MKRCACAALVLFALSWRPSRAIAESPLGFRIGVSRSQLDGELGANFPKPAFSGTFGFSLRTAWSPWRLRTGLSYVARVGHGTALVHGLVQDSTGFIHEGVIGYEDAVWRTQWLDLPLSIEYVFGHGKTRPYASLGEALGYLLPASEGPSESSIPPNKAQQFNVSGSAAAGIEFKLQKGTARVELEFAQGLRSLYDSANGPDGSWRAWTLVVDVSP